MKPVLFVTGHVPAYRTGAFARLHEREGIELALFGGGSLHAGPAGPEELPFPARRAGPAELASLAAGGGYRAVVCPTGGRAALLATWMGARLGRVPLILWASLWAHPRSAAHALSYVPLRRLYGSADAVVTYGPHVSEYVRARGAHNVHVAPQSVDNDYWGATGLAKPDMPGWPAGAALRYLFVGRPAPEKGLAVLLDAWRMAGRAAADEALVIAGGTRGPSGRALPLQAGIGGVHALGALPADALRGVYAASDVLVVPSTPTRTFREPWGLVANEGMNQGLAVIASDAVGAAAGGLVRDGETGLVVPAADAGALAAAIERLALDRPLRDRLAQAGRRAVSAYTHDAWAEGFSRALATVGLARARW